MKNRFMEDGSIHPGFANKVAKIHADERIEMAKLKENSFNPDFHQDERTPEWWKIRDVTKYRLEKVEEEYE